MNGGAPDLAGRPFLIERSGGYAAATVVADCGTEEERLP
jgi:hypothetical protein